MKIKIAQADNQSVLSYLDRNKVNLASPCGGHGTCGKCRVKVLNKEVTITDEDRYLFTEKQLKEGYRLGCKLIAVEGLEIEVEEDKEKDFRIVSSYHEINSSKMTRGRAGLGVGIDIGTTTIAMELINLETGTVMAAHTTLNTQKKYGADVISRINFSSQGGVEVLKECVQADILLGINGLCQKAQVEKLKIVEVVIAGNTTMLHTVLGLNCESLGKYPFTPLLLDTYKAPFKEVWKESSLDAELVLLPSISTYIGADIVSGLYHCKMHETQPIKLFIDIGTNGEMAIGNKHKIMTLATAAGPAFEGGNISCGVGSTKGAICKVSYASGKFSCQTIGDVEPTGICGSGLIDIMKVCIQNELIDETGYITNGDERIIIYEKGQNIIELTQKDIRQVQLAKAAIRAGVEVLISHYGSTYEEIDELYLAGGFGMYLTIESMVTIGLIPSELKNKIVKVGNSSLGGCILYLTSDRSDESLEDIRKKSEAMNLAESLEFNRLFVEQMMFEI